MPIYYTIPIFIPELACPFQCVFCNQEKISGRQHIPDEPEIIKTIADHLDSFKSKDMWVELGFFGGSFTGIPIEEQKRYLQIAQAFIDKNEINTIRLSTRPDYVTEEILAVLKNYHVSTIELGAQSMDDNVLKASFRGHTVIQTEEAAKMILANDFELGLQMMIGLPGDTIEKSINTAKKIIELGATNTRIYPAVVIRGTTMHKWYEAGKYAPLSMEEAIQWTSQILPLFEEAGVKVLRVGLHPSEGLLSGHELVAGPFHQSFKELVLTEIWRQQLDFLLENEITGNLIIHISPRELNYAIGYGSRNKKRLLQKFKSVAFVSEESLNHREYNYLLD